MKNLIGFTTLLCLVVSFSSCKKRKLNRDTTTTVDAALIEGAFNDVQKVSEDALKEEGLEGRSDSGFRAVYGNPSVTVSPAWPDTTFPKIITLDFGAGTTDSWGVTRTGELKITATGYYRDEGATFTILPSDYTVNANEVSGQKSITNEGRNSAGNLWFTIEISNGLVTKTNGETIEWESTREREWIDGESTNYLNSGVNGIFDDEYSITGSATGKNTQGRNYTINITNPLIVSLDCKWVKEGTLTLEPEDLDIRTVDYGNGTCDRDATVTIRNRSYDITMW